MITESETLFVHQKEFYNVNERKKQNPREEGERHVASRKTNLVKSGRSLEHLTSFVWERCKVLLFH